MISIRTLVVAIAALTLLGACGTSTTTDDAAGTDGLPDPTTSDPATQPTQSPAPSEPAAPAEVTTTGEVAAGGALRRPLPYDVALPPGFRIDVYADRVPNARSMALGANGTLFVGTRNDTTLYALRDLDGDHFVDETIALSTELDTPNGVAFRDGSLYVAEVDRVLRYDDIENRLDDPPEPVVVSAEFPSEPFHGWKYIAFGPDGMLYVPVGAPCNTCETDDTPYGKIWRMNPDGSDLEVFASGMRNTVGFDWHPVTGDLWWTDNGADELGDDVPPDELNRSAEPGLHYGFPYCHAGTVPDPEFGAERSCDEFTPPAQALGPHVAALGMTFYTGDSFPEEYRNQIFIAEHGSWNRTDPIGYRITLARLDDASEVTSYEVFAEGWLADDGTVHGRPVDVLVMADGSLLVSDDRAGMIYRISYEG